MRAGQRANTFQIRGRLLPVKLRQEVSDPAGTKRRARREFGAAGQKTAPAEHAGREVR